VVNIVLHASSFPSPSLEAPLLLALQPGLLLDLSINLEKPEG
jgi:hypothetical protein